MEQARSEAGPGQGGGVAVARPGRSIQGPGLRSRLAWFAAPLVGGACAAMLETLRGALTEVARRMGGSVRRYRV